MPQILRTTLIPNRTIPAAGETEGQDLPVNPISHLVVTLRALNNDLVASNFRPSVLDYLSKFTNFQVTYRGASVVNADPMDLAMLVAHYTGHYPSQGQVTEVDNDVRALSLVIPFGRRLYNPVECFPATRRGDLRLQWTAGADPTGLDTYTMLVESVELLEARPERFVKITETQRIMQLGDVNEVELPIGNKILGILLRAFTFPTGASQNSSYGSLSLEVDNVETVYSGTNWESLHGETWAKWRSDWAAVVGHTHTVFGSGAAAAAYAQATALGIAADADGTSITTGTAARRNITGVQRPALDLTELQRYAMLDLDPAHDDSMGLPTAGAARIHLQVNSDVTDATASRALPVELVPVAAAAAIA